MYFYISFYLRLLLFFIFSFFFFNDTATTEIYTLSLHDALPICQADYSKDPKFTEAVAKKIYYGSVYFRRESEPYMTLSLDRKSTRLNSSHVEISYAVFCLKKKKKEINNLNMKLCY